MINKTLLGVVASTVVATNSFASVPTTSNLKVEQEVDPSDFEQEACTVFCVGKDASEDGHAIIARSADAGPAAMNMNATVFKHNALANKTIKSNTGFEYKMPKETYRYVSTPRNPIMHKGLHWEASGINECGVAVTATLSCVSRDEIYQDEKENFIQEGLSEDNITQIVAATAKTARQGVETLATILKEIGSRDANAVVIADQSEIWYMEIYTRHNFIAVKMPDNCVCSVGNEFMLGTTAQYGENIIRSENLFNFAREKQIDSYPTGLKHTDENMDLFATYAKPLSLDPAANTDYNHMRTWRGYNMFAKGNQKYEWAKVYKTLDRYDSFYVPDDLLGVDDVITFMRDRYQNILGDPQDDNHNHFVDLQNQGKLRYVAHESAYQIHVIKMHQELPAQIACEEWLCMSNSSFAPFVPITNGAKNLSDYYTHVSTTYGFDDKSAESIFKKLNTLGDLDDKHWGQPVQDLWTFYENIWKTQWNQVLNDLKGKSTDRSAEALEILSINIQEQAIRMAKFVYDDLLLHIANTTRSLTPTDNVDFIPLIDLKEFSQAFGWKYKKEGKYTTLTQGEDTIQVRVNGDYDPNPQKNPNGGLSINGGEEIKVWTSVKGDTSYLEFRGAKNFISNQRKLVPININDLKRTNNLAWIIPICVIVPLLIIAAVVTIVIKRRKPNSSSIKTNKK